MLEEHRIGRGYANRMQEALEPARGGSEEALSRLLSGARDYVALIRNHIMKEDHVLFEMADQMVRGPACMSLCGDYDSVCAAAFEGHSKAELEAMAADLQGRVLG